ncbi:MAG: hypothetical protein HYX72_09610 [Acidobacteria bacterium]|nr:hypothetical protein [Acidobacteriota bacterium]
MGRVMHDIDYDEIHDEFTVPQFMAQAILTFRGGANGEEPPIRVIQGPLTQLRQPARVTVDPLHNEIFVPQESDNEILVFPREANGNVAPIRILKGPPDSRGLGPSALAVDPVHNLLIVATNGPRGERTESFADNRIRIYNRTDHGNAKPRGIIGGPKSGFYELGGPMAVHPPKGVFFLPVGGPGPDTDFVGVWSVHDNGDVPPRWTIGPAPGLFRSVHGVAVDPKSKSVFVTDKDLNAVMTFSFPEIF